MVPIIISILSLLVALTSLFYTLSKSKFKVVILDYHHEINRGEHRISFTIANNSPASLFIDDVSFYQNNSLISEMNFDIYQYDKNAFDIKRNSKQIHLVADLLETFQPPLDVVKPVKQTLLAPYQKIEVSTYVFDEPSSIKITTDKHISGLSKSKSFIVRAPQN